MIHARFATRAAAGLAALLVSFSLPAQTADTAVRYRLPDPMSRQGGTYKNCIASQSDCGRFVPLPGPARAQPAATPQPAQAAQSPAAPAPAYPAPARKTFIKIEDAEAGDTPAVQKATFDSQRVAGSKWQSINSAADHEKAVAAGRCFWMENMSGRYRWVPAETMWGRTISNKECFQLDSCDGGLGESHGGCYKWAADAHAERMPW